MISQQRKHFHNYDGINNFVFMPISAAVRQGGQEATQRRAGIASEEEQPHYMGFLHHKEWFARKINAVGKIQGPTNQLDRLIRYPLF